ncbi:26400_t:CDS:2, partial [Dentiscutata erythropus]
MPSHISLLTVIITVKNNNFSSYGFAKYKLSEQTSYIIRFKHFFSNNSLSQYFTSGDLVFISGKFAVENSEQCMTISYASIIDNNLNREFDLAGYLYAFPTLCFLLLSTVTRKQRKISSILVPNALRSNIRITNTYLVSGLFRFSDSGKIMIEATDIDYSKMPLLTFNTPEISSSSSSNTRSIFDIIANDIDSAADNLSKKPSYIKHNSVATSSSSKILPALNVVDVKANLSLENNNYIKLDAENKNNDKEHDSEREHSENDNLLCENDQEEDYQPKKRKR